MENKKIISSFLAFNLYHGFVSRKAETSGQQGMNPLLYLEIDSPILQRS